MERYELARFFYTDPTAFAVLPMSEYRRRRKYWIAWRKAQGLPVPDEHGIVKINEGGLDPSSVVIGE